MVVERLNKTVILFTVPSAFCVCELDTLVLKISYIKSWNLEWIIYKEVKEEELDAMLDG